MRFVDEKGEPIGYTGGTQSTTYHARCQEGLKLDFTMSNVINALDHQILNCCGCCDRLLATREDDLTNPAFSPF